MMMMVTMVMVNWRWLQNVEEQIVINEFIVVQWSSCNKKLVEERSLWEICLEISRILVEVHPQMCE